MPAQLRFRLIGSRRGKRATGKANLNRRRDADCTTVPALFQRGEASLHSEMEREILRFGPKIRCSGEGKLLTPIFLFPRKALFSLLLLSAAHFFRRHKSTLLFPPFFAVATFLSVPPQMGRKRRSDVRPISQPDRLLHKVVVDLKII